MSLGNINIQNTIVSVSPFDLIERSKNTKYVNSLNFHKLKIMKDYYQKLVNEHPALKFNNQKSKSIIWDSSKQLLLGLDDLNFPPSNYLGHEKYLIEPEDLKEKNKEETMFDFFHTPRNKFPNAKRNLDKIKKYSSIGENRLVSESPPKKRPIKRLIPITENNELIKKQNNLSQLNQDSLKNLIQVKKKFWLKQKNKSKKIGNDSPIILSIYKENQPEEEEGNGTFEFSTNLYNSKCDLIILLNNLRNIMIQKPNAIKNILKSLIENTLKNCNGNINLNFFQIKALLSSILSGKFDSKCNTLQKFVLNSLGLSTILLAPKKDDLKNLSLPPLIRKEKVMSLKNIRIKHWENENRRVELTYQKIRDIFGKSKYQPKGQIRHLKLPSIYSDNPSKNAQF